MRYSANHVAHVENCNKSLAEKGLTRRTVAGAKPSPRFFPNRSCLLRSVQLRKIGNWYRDVVRRRIFTVGGWRLEGTKTCQISVVEVWGLALGSTPAMKAKKTELLGLGCCCVGPRLKLGARYEGEKNGTTGSGLLKCGASPRARLGPGG
jgi:hypothetical protein